ncbi:MAG: pentapeptide repeat-containing protein [bacterium]|nr:pentapeptide repeat-containing protein [bacterium]
MSDINFGDLFREGVASWNAWRKAHPDVIPGLPDEQFSYEDLSGIDFSGMHLDYEDLSSATLIGANFSNAELDHTDLSDADLKNANFEGANAACVNLWGAFLEGANFRGATLAEASLKETHLQGAILDKANLWRAYLLDAEGLTVVQLSRVKTLWEIIDLDSQLLDAVREHNPKLLHKPESFF